MRRKEYNEHLANRSYLRRIWVAALIAFLCLLLLFIRFISLQIVHFERYSKRADTNRIAILPVVPSRGAIIDRKGVVLAYNEATYTVAINPSKVADVDKTIAALQTYLPITERDIKRFKQNASNAKRKFIDIPLYSGLTQSEVAVVSAQLYRFPGVELDSKFTRTYPLQEAGSHILGYIGGITDDDLTRLADNGDADNYRGTQEIGRVGIEAQYERLLHGRSGIEEVEITAGGRPVQRLREIGSEPGHTIQLTLDIRLQKLVEDLYGDRRGAFVAIDPRNGEILALVSKPTFNPNIFIQGFDHDTWSELNDTPNQPLFHRAIGGTYPIGSTYKPFMALAGMQTGTRGPKDIYDDKTGVYSLGNRVWRSTGATGKTDATRAIIKSSNVYFYSLAYEMGVEKIHDFMKPWGFGQLTGVDLGGEVRGILPTKAWKKGLYQKNPEQGRWYDGETLNLGIGQGHNRFTILQLASAVATLANKGQRYTPHFLMVDKNVMTGQLSPYELGTGEMMGVMPEYLDVVTKAMAEVPIQGTARWGFIGAEYLSAGKTGTAQATSVPQGARYNAALLEEFQRDHSLYIAFAPVENPEIAIALIVENAGFGAASAVPIARRAIDYHLLGIYPSVLDMRRVQQKSAGAPIGEPRKADVFDIIPAEQLVPLSKIEANVTEVNTWGNIESRQEVANDAANEVANDAANREVQ